MRCKYCNISIKCKTDVCPICHEKLTDTDICECDYFPPKTPHAKSKVNSFSVGSIYTFCAAVISIVCIITNVLVNSDILWSLPLTAILFYGILIIKNSIASNQSVALKIIWHEIYLFLVCLMVQSLFDVKIKTFAYEYALPFLSVAGILAMAIFFIVARKTVRQHLWGAVGLCFYGCIPIILFSCGVNTLLWPSLTSAVFSTVSLLGLIIFGRRALGNEFKRKFHF